MAEKAGKSYLFVGLGNPGRKYRKTRHNLGFLTVERFAEEQGWTFKLDATLVSEVAKGNIEGDTILLVKPQTYMNLSGDAVQRVMRYYRIPLSTLVVVADDVALPLGQLRLRMKGSAGGHNGLKSIETSLGTELYKRLKLGIKCDKLKEMPLEAYVLSEWDKEQDEAVRGMLAEAVEALKLLLREIPERAMNQINKTESSEKGEEKTNESKTE